MNKTYVNWSTGKDSALALYHLLKDDNYSIDKLLCSMNQHFDRVSMHGLRRELLEAQAISLQIPLQTIELPQTPSMSDYEAIMTKTVNTLKEQGFTHSAFGDIFLEDLRAYRDQQLSAHKIETIYPLWKRDTSELIHEFLSLGFKAVVVSANADYFDEGFVGTVLSPEIISKLPPKVDPCGENGEFHTFCFDGPIFHHPINFKIGEKVYKEYPKPTDEDTCTGAAKDTIGFWYCDLTLS